MESYIIVPTQWIEQELAICAERIIEYGDAEYYTSKMLLLHKMLHEFKIIKNSYETAKERNTLGASFV